MRVGVIALSHESNTFVRGTTSLGDFEADLLVEGNAVREKLAGAHHEVGGFFAELAEQQIEAVPLFAARALPAGPIAAEAAETLLGRLRQALDRAGPLDGILAAPHGAAVAEHQRDFDGEWLSIVRQHIGKDIPLIATLDMHANVSAKMVAACDAPIAYRTNPHLDQRARGREAANLMARTIRKECRPITAAIFPPLAINIVQQATAISPCRELFAEADQVRNRPGILATSLVLGFPYADVAEMGASILVVADGNKETAVRGAVELAEHWWSHRSEFTAALPNAEDAVRVASRLDGPICLLDVGDNVGGGSPADGTTLAYELYRQRLGPSVACLADAEAVRAATAAGRGATVRLQVGGKTDALHGLPLETEFVVRGLFEGRFQESQPRHGGITHFDQGPTAVVETPQGLTIVLTTRRMAPFSIHQLTSCDLKPERFRVLVAKGVHSPVAAYAPFCKHMIQVGTPGATTAELSLLEYHHRRRPMFPFEAETVWSALV